MQEYTVIYNVNKNKYQVTGWTGNTLSIPSKMFPLKGSKPLRLFSWENTSECCDERILSVLSNFKMQLGRCYENTERLAELLRREGVEPARIKTYISWTMFGNIPGYPVHHCITVVDDKHVFDMIPIVPADVTQEEYIDIMAKHYGCYSLDLYGKGKVQRHICHIAKECSPEEALEQRYELEDRYPNHPAFRTIQNGYTETQKAIFKKRNEGNYEQAKGKTVASLD